MIPSRGKRTAAALSRVLATLAIVLAVPSTTALSQTATEPALKAALLYNFALFTEWPADVLAPGAPLLLCVMNDRGVSTMLVDLTRGRTIDGHKLVVSSMKPDSPGLEDCRVLFTSGLDASRAAALLLAVDGKPVLTVSDVDGFAERGGVAGFFVEKGSMRFAINLAAAQRAGIRLSSKLLSFAKIVKDTR